MDEPTSIDDFEEASLIGAVPSKRKDTPVVLHATGSNPIRRPFLHKPGILPSMMLEEEDLVPQSSMDQRNAPTTSKSPSLRKPEAKMRNVLPSSVLEDEYDQKQHPFTVSPQGTREPDSTLKEKTNDPNNPSTSATLVVKKADKRGATKERRDTPATLQVPGAHLRPFMKQMFSISESTISESGSSQSVLSKITLGEHEKSSVSMKADRSERVSSWISNVPVASKASSKSSSYNETPVITLRNPDQDNTSQDVDLSADMNARAEWIHNYLTTNEDGTKMEVKPCSSGRYQRYDDDKETVAKIKLSDMAMRNPEKFKHMTLGSNSNVQMAQTSSLRGLNAQPNRDSVAECPKSDLDLISKKKGGIGKKSFKSQSVSVTLTSPKTDVKPNEDLAANAKTSSSTSRKTAAKFSKDQDGSAEKENVSAALPFLLSKLGPKTQQMKTQDSSSSDSDTEANNDIACLASTTLKAATLKSKIGGKTTLQTVSGLRKWQGKAKKYGVSSLRSFAKNDGHYQYIMKNIENVAVEMPLPLKKVLVDECETIVKDTVRGYERTLGKSDELTINARAKYEEIQKLAQQMETI